MYLMDQESAARFVRTWSVVWPSQQLMMTSLIRTFQRRILLPHSLEGRVTPVYKILLLLSKQHRILLLQNAECSQHSCDTVSAYDLPPQSHLTPSLSSFLQFRIQYSSIGKFGIANFNPLSFSWVTT